MRAGAGVRSGVRARVRMGLEHLVHLVHLVHRYGIGQKLAH